MGAEMGDDTKLSWCDATWNPIEGCRRVSPGCENCYAERVAGRACGKDQPYHGLARMTAQGERWTGEVRFRADRLTQPLHWTRPRLIFVNSMSDLFMEGLTNEQIAAIFGIMAAAPQHTFQVLTKRAARMVEWFEWAYNQREQGTTTAEAMRADALDVVPGAQDAEGRYQPHVRPLLGHDIRWPLPNVWIGVSVEDQQRAEDRIPLLLKVPAAVRFLSVEPMIGPVDLRPFIGRKEYAGNVPGVCVDIDGQTWHGETVRCLVCGWGFANAPCCPYRVSGIGWVIVGGESVPETDSWKRSTARPLAADWVRTVRDQCLAVKVPFFFKQWGGQDKAAAGRTLDGRIWDEMPNGLSVPVDTEARRKELSALIQAGAD